MNPSPLYEIQPLFYGEGARGTHARPEGPAVRVPRILFLTLMYHVVIILGAPKPRFNERSQQRNELVEHVDAQHGIREFPQWKFH